MELKIKPGKLVLLLLLLLLVVSCFKEKGNDEGRVERTKERGRTNKAREGWRVTSPHAHGEVRGDRV